MKEYTEEEKRQAVKAVCQFMVDKYMTGNDALRNALMAFDVQVVQRWETPNLDGTTYHVAVFNSMTPDGSRYEFGDKATADAFAARNEQ